MAYDVEAARKSGMSDSQIKDYLMQTRAVDSKMVEGKSDDEVINSLRVIPKTDPNSADSFRKLFTQQQQKSETPFKNAVIPNYSQNQQTVVNEALHDPEMKSPSFLSKVGSAITETGKGFAKEIGGTIQGLGKLPMYAVGKGAELLTGNKTLKEAAIKSGVSADTLESKNAWQNFGKGIGFGAELLTPGFAPETIVSKVGMSGLIKAGEKKLLTPEIFNTIKNAVTSKFGQKAIQLLSDFVQGSTLTTASELGAGQEPDLNTVMGGGATSMFGGQVTRKVGGKLAGKTPDEMSQKTYEDALNITRPKLSSKATESAFQQGRFTNKGTIAPNLQEQRVAEAVQPLIDSGEINQKMIKANDLPTIRNVMAQDVSRTNAGVREMIAKNNTPVSEADIIDRLNKAKQDRIFPDKPSEELYDKVSEKIQTFIKNKDTLGLFDARQDFDSYIRKSMGEKVFEKSDSASLAVQDMRSAVNQFVSDLLPENNPYKSALLRESNLITGIKQMSTQAPEMFKEANKSFFEKYPALKKVLIGTGLITAGAVGIPAVKPFVRGIVPGE